MSPLATDLDRDGGVPSRAAIGARALAWSAHFLTATGAVVGIAALAAIAAGRLRAAIFLLAGAFLIDAVDGAFARRVGVTRHLPGFDGRRLDDLVDFLNYVVVPACFMLQANTLLHPAWVALPVLASCYGFCQVDAKTEDDFFLGFPSLWNAVAAYAWGLDVSQTASTLWVAFLSVMVFVPLKYVYPSKLRVLRRTTVCLAVVWGALLLSGFAATDRRVALPLLEASLFFPVYYFALGLWLGHVGGRRS